MVTKSMKSLFDKRGEEETVVTMCGLDQAGKTTILQYIQTGEHTAPRRTLGFSINSLTIQNMQFKVQDLGGQFQFRESWASHLRYSNIVIYVIEASNRERFSESRNEMSKVLTNMAPKAKLLVLCHKQDVENAAKKEEIVKFFQLENLGMEWSVMETSAITGQGLRDMVVWLYEIATGKKLRKHKYNVPVRCYEQKKFMCVLKQVEECTKEGYDSCYLCDHANCQNCDNVSPDCFM
ncbi:MAG: ADP-ribosylation factor family protein [Candidatus Odinarchaeota archaeon]